MKKILIGLICSAFMIGSCKKKEENVDPPVSESTESAEDNAVAENEFTSIYDMVDDEAKNDTSIYLGKMAKASTLPACAERTYDINTKTLTITFKGSANQNASYPDHCLCNDGMYRKGTIKTVFTGAYRTQGSTANIELVDYFVNNYPVTGKKLITNLGNSSGHFKYSVKVTDAGVTTAKGKITWTSDRTVERIEGDTTITPWDDVYLITGSASGINRRNIPFSVIIDANNPLKKQIKVGCLSTFISGILTITNTNNNKSMSIDYDPDKNANCDKVAEVNVNGSKRRITVR